MSLPNGLKIWLALGADLTRNPSFWTWTDVTAYTLHDDGGGVTIDIGYPEGSDEASATRIAFLANNQDGRWSPNNPAGAWFGQIDIDTPVKVTFDPGSGDVTRGIAFLADLPLEWTTGGKFRFVRVEAFGRLARMETADSLDSNARRTALFWGPPIGYWPAEDAGGSLKLASAIAGQPDASIAGTTATNEFAGSKPLVAWTATAHVGGTIAPYVRPQPEAWAFVFALSIPSRPSATTPFFLVRLSEPPATFRYFLIEIDNGTPATVFLRAYTAAGAELLSDAGINFTNVSANHDHEPFDERIGVEFSAVQNGTGIDWSMTLWGEGGTGQATSGTLASNTLGPLTFWGIGAQANMDGWTLGHFAAYTASSSADAVAPDLATAGVGTTAGARFEAQAAMDPSLLAAASDGAAGPPMGPVPTDSLLMVLRECATANGGLFWERPDGTLYLLALGDLYDRSVALSLVYGTHLRNLAPISAVRDFVNRVTVSQPSGGAGVTVDATGPLGPATRGVVRSKSVTVNTQFDTDLRSYAQWIAALGTVQDSRYTVDLQFHGKASSKLATWLTMDIGDRVQITSPPAWLPPDTIDGYVRGYTEHINRHEYDLTLRLLPYRPYLSWTVEGSGNTGRADTSGSRLLAAVTSSGTSAIVGTYGNPRATSRTAAKWSTASVPYDLAIRAAERVTCTAAANNAPTFVAAGAASHGDAIDLTPALPAGLTAGDLVLCLAAIRSTSGQIFESTETWTRLPIFGSSDNVALWATTYASGMAAPVMNFFGTFGAGDTTSAQTCAFRYAQPVVHATAVRTANAAAANISVPGLVVQRNGCVIIAAGWKQDDWTSVATLSGFTEIGEPSTTTGNDQGLVWDYVIQTTATDIASTSFVVTGGTNQISKAGVVAILGDCQTLTLTRNVNSISGGVAHPAGSEVNLWRAGVVRRP